MSVAAQALLYGSVVGASFTVGAMMSRLNPFGHKGFSAVMGFGAGLLLAAALSDLAPHAVDGLDLAGGIAVVVASALVYSAVNLWLKLRGGEHRKRCGGCEAPPSEAEQSGSGLSITVGTVMDAFPEALVLGVAVAGMGAPMPLVAALFLGNAAQAMSATSGLRASGRGPRFVWGLWLGLGAMIAGATVVAALFGSRAGPAVEPVLMGIAAGVLIAMIAEAMLPEATDQPAPFLGLSAALGVAAFFALH